MAQFPFVGASYSPRAGRLDAQQCINLYPEVGGPSSKNVAALIGTPGLRLWATLPTNGVRGMLRFSKTLAVVVSGSNAYIVRQDATYQDLGPASMASNGPVSMASNGSVVMLVTGPDGYIIDPVAATMRRMLDDAFVGADRVDFIDGYFVFNKPGTGQFQITGLYSDEIDLLDFATSEGSPDLLVSLLVDHREVWLFNETTTEVYYNSGDVDFPLERMQGAFIEQGCAAASSVAKADNSVLWLTSDDRGKGMVMRANGYQPQRVSDHAVEYAIGKYPRIDDAVAYTYQQEGHVFYVLSFPSGNATWVLDLSTNMWHQRAWRDPTTGTYSRHRASTHMSFADCSLVGDWENGNIYVLDLDEYTDNGDPLPRVRVCPYLSDSDYRGVIFDRLQVDMEAGVGLVTGQGSDPKAMLSWSDDGAKSWSNETWSSIGKIGERNARVRWSRLGTSRNRVFKLVITDPVKVSIVGASVATRQAAT